ncbi:MAG: hypothetical protein JNK04_19810, partial [Myxococcales bacterium]|nr:hypothetical protein [Myxococcales bacterium]
MKRFIAATLPWLCLAFGCTPEESTEGSDAATGALTPSGPLETFFVVLDGPPAVKAIPAGMDARSPEASPFTKKRVAEIAAEQAVIEPLIVAEGAEVIARMSRLANVLEVVTDQAAALRIAKLPGVRRVESVPVIERSLISAVP